MSAPRYSMYLYPWDVLDAETTPIAARISKLGITAVKLAAVYHSGKVLLPQNARRRVYIPEDGALYFRPSSEFYSQSPVYPPVAGLCNRDDPLLLLCKQAEQCGLEVDAWVLCLHNRAIARLRPDLCTVNAFGEFYPHSLCPLQPDVRAYLAVLIAELARRPVRSVVLEALGFVPFDHYAYRQIEGVEVGPGENLLLSLCFCGACTRAFPGLERVRPDVRRELTNFFHSGRTRALADRLDRPPMLQELVQARMDAITRLTAELAAYTTRAGKRFAVIASSPLKNLITGIDLGDIGPVVDSIDYAYYRRDLDGLPQELTALHASVPESCAVDLLLRPGYPDIASGEDLSGKVSLASQSGVRSFSFYNYGLLCETSLDWVRDSIQATAAASR